MSAVSGIFGALQGRKSQKETARSNERNVQATNATNVLLDIVARGGTIPASIGGIRMPPELVGQSSAVLPYYLGVNERELGNAAVQMFNASLGVEEGGDTGPAIRNMIARDEAIVRGYEPQAAAGDQLVSDIFSGDVTRAMQEEAAPVQAGRIKLANMERDAGIEALSDKLNEIRTIQGRKGYSGDSLASQRLEFDARRRIGTDTARRLGGAELENAQETQRIQGAGRDLAIRSLDVPFNRAGQRINLANLPTQSAQTRFSAALAPLNFFRVGGANFQVQAPPERSSVPSVGQIAFTGVGSANRMLGTALADRYGRTTPNESMPNTVVGPGGQAYLNTGNSYVPASGNFGANYGAAAATGALSNAAWTDAVVDSISY